MVTRAHSKMHLEGRDECLTKKCLCCRYMWRQRQDGLEFEASLGYTKPRALHLLGKYPPSVLLLALTSVFKFP